MATHIITAFLLYLLVIMAQSEAQHDGSTLTAILKKAPTPLAKRMPTRPNKVESGKCECIKSGLCLTCQVDCKKTCKDQTKIGKQCFSEYACKTQNKILHISSVSEICRSVNRMPVSVHFQQKLWFIFPPRSKSP